MSEPDDAELKDLERRLDGAFAAARPRAGFQDELWARLQPRRPWWRPAIAPAPALGALAAVLLLGGLAAFLVPRAHLGQGSPGPTAYNARSSQPGAAPKEGASG